MDDRLEKALEHANYNASLAMRRENLKTKFNNDIILAEGGGLFKVDAAFLSFIDLLIRQGHKSAVLIDTRELPIMIENLEAMLENAMSVYVEATQGYRSEYEKLRTARKVKAIVGL